MTTYDTLMVGITQPVLDTWCRRCEKFGHTATHARVLAHDCSNRFCWIHATVSNLETS
jgi:hypothetical protein